MHKFAAGKLKSGSGKKVTNRKQAIAIALNQAGLSKNFRKLIRNERRRTNKKV